MKKYNKKMVISGKFIDIYEYDKMVVVDFKRDINLNKKSEEKSDNQKSQSSIHRTKKNIKNITNSNPQLTKFLTLTFKKNVEDINFANYKFMQFVKRMKFKYPDFKYLAVIEFQKRGAVHYHMLCKLPYVNKKLIAKKWNHGFIKIKRINRINNMGGYISKYVSKDTDNMKLFNKKKFFHSKDLYMPLEIIDEWQFNNYYNNFDIENRNPIFEKTIESEYRGKIKIKQYIIE